MQKKILISVVFIIAIILCFAVQASAQTSADISFLTQAQINDLAQLYSKKLNKIKEKGSATKETLDLNNALKKYNVPDSIQLKLDDINSKSITWTANYNNIFVKSDQYKKNLLGLKLDGQQSSFNLSNFFSKILGYLQNFNPSKALAELVITPTRFVPIDNFGDNSLPVSFDWRNVGGRDYITPVRDQGNCGSCWAFATMASLEGNINAYYNNPNISQNLSEQDLISCGYPYNSLDKLGGCEGAYPDQIEKIFKSYLPNTGVTQENCFVYSGTDKKCSKCKTWQTQVWKTNNSYQSITPTIDNIKSALVNYGPVEVGMLVYDDFFAYTSGVYSHTINTLDGGHTVTIVGYGNDGNNVPYWIVKNSWGTNWGENGYFKIKMGDSSIDQRFAYVPGVPSYTTSYTKLCTDNDKDNYCYWGIGTKPTTGCPLSCASAKTEDCDDSNSSFHNGCGSRTDAVSCIKTNSGPNYSNAGTTTVIYNDGSRRSEKDFCRDSSTLYEWYCGSSGDPAGLLRSNPNYKCPKGCSNGACVK